LGILGKNASYGVMTSELTLQGAESKCVYGGAKQVDAARDEARPGAMSESPLEPDSVEYVEAEPIAQPRGYAQPVVYQSEGLPCCSGCGCLLLTIFVLFFSTSGSLLTGLVILLSAVVLSSSALRIAGVRRWSPAYAYAVVPVFLVSINLTTRIFRGAFAYSALEVIGATLLIWAFLYAGRALGRR
jgi:hypothetical protein